MADGREINSALEARVDAVLAEALPAVELLELTVSGEMMRVVVDHPDGVDHGVCSDVTRALDRAGLLQDYGAEVWSPGPEPPLRTLDHYRAVIGRRVRVRLDGSTGSRSCTGELAAVEDDLLRIVVAGRPVEIPWPSVRRGRALEESPA